MNETDTQRYFVRFAYRGTDFHGSQSQPNACSVQQTMEEAFSTILRCPVSLTFAGRTDAGVHARCMYAHMDSTEPLPGNLASRLNHLLPPSIVVYDIQPVANDAHARFDATLRTYEYHISTQRDPFRQNQVAIVAPGLDFERMNEAAQLLLGRQDFASFCRVHTDVKTTICTVSRAEWQQVDEHHAVFTIAADRFLRNMVRAVVGTLLDVGRGKLSITEFADIISAHNRCSAGQSATADGLYLVDIRYPFPLEISINR